MKSFSGLALLMCLGVSGSIVGCGGGFTGSSGNGGGGGGGQNPTPTISSISPSSAPQSGPAFSLTLNGSGFVFGSQVLFGQTTLATTYVSASQLTAQVPASNLAAQGAFAITVSNPSPGGGTSSAVSFTVGNPVPVLSSIQPSSALAGGAALTLNVSGSAFLSTSQVEWNGTPLTTTYENSTTLSAQVPAADLMGGTTNISASVTVVNSSPNGGASSAKTFQVLAPLTYLRTINLPVNDIVWDATHGKIYASLPGADTNGNSVVAIDPISAVVGTPQPAGKEPDVLALSDDNSFLYAGLDGTGTVARFSLPSLTPDPSLGIQLPNDPINGQLSAITLAVAPGNSHTLAVRIGTFNSSPANIGGVAVYDDSTQRPKVIPSFPREDMQDVQWGANASVLYGSSDDTNGDFRVMSVDSTGVSIVSDYQNADPTSGNIHFDRSSGFAYIDGGWVIDPARGSVAGAFNTSPMVNYFNADSFFNYQIANPLCVPDSERGVVFFLGQTDSQYAAHAGVIIQAFDAKTYRLLATLPISGATGYPARFLRWGTSGLAFIMAPTRYFPGGGPIYLVDGSFVNQSQIPDSTSGTPTRIPPRVTSISPQSAVTGAPGFTMTATGSNFFPSSTVMWSSFQLQTTFVSSSELQASVPSGELTGPGNVVISVSDSVTGLQSAASAVFSIVPASGSTTILAMNIAGCNSAWDSKSQQLLLPVLSADSQYPNMVVGVNPATGAVVHTAQVQPDPCAFSATDDGSYAYTGFGAANYITRLSLPNLDASMTWTLPTDPQEGPLWAYDLQPAPGAAHTIAADFAASNRWPPYAGNVTVYDDGVARAQTATSGGRDDGNIQWGAGSSQVYTANPTTGGWIISTYNVDASGVTFAQRRSIPGPAPTGGAGIHFDSTTGYLYDDSGSVYDPVSDTSVGNYNASGFVALDAAMNRVFILGQIGNGYAIQSFDKTGFARVGYLGLPPLVGTPVAFIRWGSNGLAILTFNVNAAVYGGGIHGDGTGPAGMLYIINDMKFVSPNSVPATSINDIPPVHSFERVSPLTAMHRSSGISD